MSGGGVSGGREEPVWGLTSSGSAPEGTSGGEGVSDARDLIGGGLPVVESRREVAEAPPRELAVPRRYSEERRRLGSS